MDAGAKAALFALTVSIAGLVTLILVCVHLSFAYYQGELERLSAGGYEQVQNIGTSGYHWVKKGARVDGCHD